MYIYVIDLRNPQGKKSNGVKSGDVKQDFHLHVCVLLCIYMAEESGLKKKSQTRAVYYILIEVL